MGKLLAGFLIVAALYGAVRPVAIVPTGPDAGVMIAGRPVQFEYLPCLADPAARWYEDGSATCWQDGADNGR